MKPNDCLILMSEINLNFWVNSHFKSKSNYILGWTKIAHLILLFKKHRWANTKDAGMRWWQQWKGTVYKGKPDVLSHLESSHLPFLSHSAGTLKKCMTERTKFRGNTVSVSVNKGWKANLNTS